MPSEGSHEVSESWTTALSVETRQYSCVKSGAYSFEARDHSLSSPSANEEVCDCKRVGSIRA